MTRIDHVAEATLWIETAASQANNTERGPLYALLAQAEAALAVAEQIKVSNLIALAVTIPDDRDGNGMAVDLMRDKACNALTEYISGKAAAEGRYALRPDIAAALGTGGQK